MLFRNFGPKIKMLYKLWNVRPGNSWAVTITILAASDLWLKLLYKDVKKVEREREQVSEAGEESLFCQMVVGRLKNQY